MPHEHIGFPEISQYRNVIRAVRERAKYQGKGPDGKSIFDPSLPVPTLKYEGTVKLHGTNAAVCLDRSTGEIWFQSRELIITYAADNAGFVREMKPKITPEFFALMQGTEIAVFGEWCGQGINGGTGISQLPKMFVVFAVKVDGRWLRRDEIFLPKMDGVHWIQEFTTYQIEIDFGNPLLVQNTLGEMTLQVEANCPVAFCLGKPGTGEGIVWTCVTPGWEDSRFWFKVKGEKHSATKVKTLAAVDVEQVKTDRAFVDATVTEARCQQSIAKLRELGKPIDRTSLGDFIRWIYNDIVKEESDTAMRSNVDFKKVGGLIATTARTWFYKNETTL